MDRFCFCLSNDRDNYDEGDDWDLEDLQHTEACRKRTRLQLIEAGAGAGASSRMGSSGDMSHQVYRFYEAQCDVGKGGIWDPDNGMYYYVDITQRTLHMIRVPDFYREDYDVGTQVGAMALVEGGWGLVMAVEDGFGMWDFSKKRLEMVATPYGINTGWRMNDGACDSKGRFWAGRLFKSDETQPGEIYRLERDGVTVTGVIQGICCTNGILWSPDNTLMYCGDSSMKKIFVWDYDEVSGNVRNKRLFMDTRPIFDGVPDGATIDNEGFLWVCFFDGHKLVRISPTAKIDRVYDLPVKRPTQPIWYGAYLDELLITSASKGVSLNDCPESGNILRLRVGVQGELKAKFKYAGNKYSLYNRRRSSTSPPRYGSPSRSPSGRYE